MWLKKSHILLIDGGINMEVLLISPVIYMLFKEKKFSFVYVLSIFYILYDIYKVYIYECLGFIDWLDTLIDIMPILLVIGAIFLKRRSLNIVIGSVYVVLHILILILYNYSVSRIKVADASLVIEPYEFFRVLISVLRIIRLLIFESFIISFYRTKGNKEHRGRLSIRERYYD